MTAPTDDTDQQGAPQGAPGPQQQAAPHGDDQQQQGPSWEELFADETPEQVREKLANARKWEGRAKENFEAAQKWRELEDGKKTPDQRTSEALEKAQREAQESTSKLMRYEVAAETGIPAADVKWLQGNTKDELLASAEEFLTRVGAAAEQRQRRGPAPDPTQGRGGAPAPLDGNDFLRQQFQNRT